MSKKLITAALALVALAAFALPATASATTSATLTEPTGTVLNPETGECTGVKKTICITAHNLGATLLKTGNTTLVECTTATMTGYLTKNTNAATEGDIHTTTFAGTGALRGEHKECTDSFGTGATIDTNLGNGTPWCLRVAESFAADEFQVRGGSCTAEPRSITFVLTDTAVGTCKYSRTAAIKGTYTTDTPAGSTQDAVLHLKAGENTEFTKEEGSFLCPASGSLEMSFTLETDNVNTEPIYIS